MEPPTAEQYRIGVARRASGTTSSLGHVLTGVVSGGKGGGFLQHSPPTRILGLGKRAACVRDWLTESWCTKIQKGDERRRRRMPGRLPAEPVREHSLCPNTRSPVVSQRT